MTLRPAILLASLVALAACSGSNTPNPPAACPPGTVGTAWPNCTTPPPPPQPPTPAGEWSIGPWIGGYSYSPGMPAATTNQSLTFPVGSSKHVGYLTKAPTGPLSLVGKTKVRLTFEIVGDGPYKANASPPDVTYVGLFFQRAGDDWSGLGQFESYRFYSIASMPDDARLKAGTFTLEVPLQRDKWTSVATNAATEADFQAAIQNASAIGFTFGNAEGKGHGVYSETPNCTFRVISYEVL